MCRFGGQVTLSGIGIVDLTFQLLSIIFILHKKGVADGFFQIFMACYQSITDYCCLFDLYGSCRFYLAAVAPFDMDAAPIFRKALAVRRNNQGLVRNSLHS